MRRRQPKRLRKVQAVRTARADSRRRLSANRAYRLFLFGFYAVPPVCFLGIIVLNGGVQDNPDPSPAIFLPVLPAGVALLLSGWLLFTNYQGVRDRFSESWVQGLSTRVRALSEPPSRYSGAIMMLIGVGLLVGGLIAAVLAVRDLS